MSFTVSRMIEANHLRSSNFFDGQQAQEKLCGSHLKSTRPDREFFAAAMQGGKSLKVSNFPGFKRSETFPDISDPLAFLGDTVLTLRRSTRWVDGNYRGGCGHFRPDIAWQNAAQSSGFRATKYDVSLAKSVWSWFTFGRKNVKDSSFGELGNA